LRTLDFLLENKIGFIALNQSIDTTKSKDPMAMAIIHLLGLFAELERNFIVERTQGGKRAKLNAGKLNALGGRPLKVTEKINYLASKNNIKYIVNWHFNGCNCLYKRLRSL